jgi:hypothetical protein
MASSMRAVFGVEPAFREATKLTGGRALSQAGPRPKFFRGDALVSTIVIDRKIGIFQHNRRMD